VVAELIAKVDTTPLGPSTLLIAMPCIDGNPEELLLKWAITDSILTNLLLVAPLISVNCSTANVKF
jgi:hypothetical protein